MAVANPYKQGETTYQDTLFQQQGVIPGSTIPTGAGLTGATAGAPVVKPKTVVPATKVIAPTPLEQQKLQYQALQPQTPTPAQPTQVILPDALDAQKLEYQAMQKQAVDQQLAKSPTEQSAQDLAVQQQQAKDAVAASAAQAGSATPTTTAATTAGTATGAPAATAQETVQENPYQKQLETMKFDYNPQTDPEYLENSAALENQVSQMMVGRGGLYSSVAASAYQSRLASLQNDFRAQKYEQFVQDRNFTLSLAKQWFDEASTKWSQQQTEKEFAFTQAKEAFDQQMAIAAYNLQVQAQQFSQSQARASARQSAQDSAFQAQVQVAGNNLAQQQQSIVNSANTYYREKEMYDLYLKRWKASGVADAYVANFFGVSQGSSLSRSTSAITAKAAYLDTYKSALKSYANEYNLSADLLDQVQLFQQNKYAGTPVQTVAQPIGDSSSWLGNTATRLQQTR